MWYPWPPNRAPIISQRVTWRRWWSLVLLQSLLVIQCLLGFCWWRICYSGASQVSPCSFQPNFLCKKHLLLCLIGGLPPPEWHWGDLTWRHIVIAQSVWAGVWRLGHGRRCRAKGSLWGPPYYADGIQMAWETSSTLEPPLQSTDSRLLFAISLLLPPLSPFPHLPNLPSLLFSWVTVTEPAIHLHLRKWICHVVWETWLHQEWGNHGLWAVRSSAGKSTEWEKWYTPREL